MSRREKPTDLVDRAFACITDYAIFVTDPDRRVLAWNAGAGQLLGYTEEEMVGHSGDVVFTPEDRVAKVPEHEEAEARLHDRASDERWHLRKDGTRFFASGIMTAIREQGQLLGFAKIMRDVTEQQRAAQALARSEQRYRLLIESIKDYAIFMLDTQGRVADWTSAAERIMGYTSDDIVGSSFERFFLPEDQQAGVPALELATVLADGHFHGVGWRVRRDGGRFWGEETATAVYDASGVVQGISKIVRDITERMLADEERERLLRQATEANRLKDEFLGTMSHELRTPLNSVLGWTRMLRERKLDADATERALAIIQRNAQSQAQLINDLLDVSRIITGKLSLRIEPMSLVEVITAALETVRPAADAKQLRLDAELDPAADLMSGDRERIQQVIWNLLTNAIKFTAATGCIMLKTERCNDSVEIACRDTGIGISPEFLPFVFDRFRQGESGTTRTQPGLGLGLAIVRHLVESHGGSVTAESGGRGAGATVRVQLPFGPQPRSAETKGSADLGLAPTPDAATSRLDTSLNLRVLAVEDDRDPVS